MPDQHSLADVLDRLSSKGKNFTFSFKELRDLFLVSTNHKHQHASFVFFKKRLDELFPDIDIPSLFRRLACEDFEAWDPRVFKSSITWLRAGHLDPLSPDDDVAKQQVNGYLYLHDIASRLKMPAVQNHIVDVIKARKTCHQGWFDASLVSYVYNATKHGDGLRRFLVDSFVYKSYQWIQYDAVAKAYWATHRSIVLFENIDEGNRESVTDQADVAAAAAQWMIQDPGTRSACHYHNHALGTKCSFAARGGLKRKRP